MSQCGRSMRRVMIGLGIEAVLLGGMADAILHGAAFAAVTLFLIAFVGLRLVWEEWHA